MVGPSSSGVEGLRILMAGSPISSRGMASAAAVRDK